MAGGWASASAIDLRRLAAFCGETTGAGACGPDGLLTVAGGAWATRVAAAGAGLAAFLRFTENKAFDFAPGRGCWSPLDVPKSTSHGCFGRAACAAHRRGDCASAQAKNPRALPDPSSAQ